jgi:iron complex transport system substrate-binding protein
MTKRPQLISRFLLLAVLLAGCATPTASSTPTLAADVPLPVEPTPTTPPAATQEPTAEVAEAPQTLTLTDSLGREISLDGPAQRVVSLGPSNTEILFAVGAGSQVVGRDDFSNFPAEANDLPGVGGSMGDYDMETIVSLNPDLVLASELVTQDQVEAMENLGLKVYLLANPLDLDGLYANHTTVARLVGHEPEAEALNASLQERVAAVVENVAAAETTPVVFYEMDASDPAKPYTTGPGTFVDQLIGLAGGKNAAADVDSSWVQLSLEQVLVIDPDIIILGDANYGITIESVAARDGWQVLTAVKENQIFPIDDDTTSRPGPRLVDGLESLAKIIHPELFSE